MLRIALAMLFLLAAAPAGSGPRIPSHCIALAQEIPGAAFVQLAGYRDTVPAGEVRISYIGHASFLIQTEDGLAAVTDYTGDLGGADLVPDVVTMNNAHITHFTNVPDPRIAHVLEGWAQRGAPRAHRIDLGGMLVRNVHTDLRAEGGRVAKNGNSIFIFEAAGLCIGHLGHLHHEPDPAQYAAIGRLDVVMAAVDGGITLDTASMIRVMHRFKARVVLPMHWFGRGTLTRFLGEMAGDFDVVEAGAREITLSLEKLPQRPTVIVLEPGPLQ